ncbi:hypothetical protein ACSBLW_03535 [Thioclava sp. FR2]|uniref:hypothetical protein n=1 Tax=Thioclava sp. FR2 TaxID=3445780 RepID=UPI003EB75DE0
MKPKTTLKVLSISVLLSTTSLVEAAEIDVVQCNILENQTYKPALLVRHDGKLHTFKVGEGKLTRRVAYNNDAALKFIARQLGLPEASLRYSQCSTAALQDGPAPTVAPVVVTPPPPPPPPPPPVDTGCSCGPCYGA